METVQNWQDIIDNLRQFQYISKRDLTQTLTTFSKFYHWYYFPLEDAFAPSKFLGYKGTTVENYLGLGSGGETQEVLKDYFDKLPKDSPLYMTLIEKLQQFASSINKNISSKTINGSGGIYIPKDNFATIRSDYSQELFDTSTDDIDSIKDEENYSGLEGQKKGRLINYFERDPKLRAKAIVIHGTTCKACDFNFEQAYGKHGKDYIEVHHIKPLHTLEEASVIDPVTDLTVVCSNCHRMIHRKRDNPLSIEDLKKLLKQYSSQHQL